MSSRSSSSSGARARGGVLYTHGHHDSVLRSHRSRTAENSAAYLIGRLQPGLDLLDVGCGPGTITRDLAKLVAPGRVVAVDAAAPILEEAAATCAAAGVHNVEFRQADAEALPFDDGSFHVVHAHQLLQHVAHPVRVLEEMGRGAGRAASSPPATSTSTAKSAGRRSR